MNPRPSPILKPACKKDDRNRGFFVELRNNEKGNHISKNRPNILAISEGKIVADLSSYIETSLKKYLVSEIDICFDFE